MGLIEVVDSSREGKLSLSQDLIFVADGCNSLHGTGQVIVGALNSSVIGIMAFRCQVLASEDGFDPKHFECNPQASFSRQFKPFLLNFISLFWAKLRLKLIHSVVHELRISIRDVKEDGVIFGLLQGSEISFDWLGKSVNVLNHIFDFDDMLAVQLFGSINLRQIIQELTGREMGGEVPSDMQGLKYSATKPGQ